MSRHGLINLPPTEVDKAVADLCARRAQPSLEETLRVLTWLADEKILLTGAVLCWLYTRAASDGRRLPRAADQMVCSIAIAGVVPHLFKRLVSRERPDRSRVHGVRRGIPKSGKAWDSFPSGHAVHVGALASAMSGMSGEKWRPLIWSAATVLAGTRVVLLAHNLTDVIAGLGIGVLIQKFVARLFNAFEG